MSFSRAAVKRFNDAIPATPAPSDYDPKLDLVTKTAAVPSILKSQRFTKNVKDVTPGPGEYHVLQRSSSLRKKATPGLRSSRKRLPAGLASSSSVDSLVLSRENSRIAASDNSKDGGSVSGGGERGGGSSSSEDVFFTPRGPPNMKSSRKDQFNWQAKCKSLEGEVTRLKEELKVAKEGQERLQSELVKQKIALETKLDQLRRARLDRDDLEARREEMRQKMEENDDRIQSLLAELKLLTKDNQSLEAQLRQEKAECEARAAFLHFTQEQLNIQLADQEDLVTRLQSEANDLKEEIATLHKELEDEREKRVEIRENFCRENENAQETIYKLTSEKDTLISEISTLCTQLSDAVIHQEEAALTSKRCDSLQRQLDESERVVLELKKKIDAISSDLDMANNDKSALLQEVDRLSQDKLGLEMDLGETMAAHNKTQQQLSLFEEENKQVLQEAQAIGEKLKRCEAQLAEKQDEYNKLLEKQERIAIDLKHEIKELEMKNSSLEGSLSSATSETRNLNEENREVTKKLEDVNEKLLKERAMVQEQKKAIASLKDDKQDLNETCVILEKRMGAAESERDAFSVALEEHRTCTSVALEKSQVIISDLEERNEDLESQLEAKSKEVRETLSEAKNTITDLEETKDKLRMALDKEHELYQTSQLALAETKSKLSEARTEHSELREQMEDLADQLKAKEAEFATLVEMNTDQSNKIEEDLNTIKQLQQELEMALQQALETRNRQEEAVASERNETKAQIVQLSELVTSLQENVDTSQKKIDDLSTALANTASERDNYANELAIIQQKLGAPDEYRVKYEELKAMIEPFREQLELFQVERDTLFNQNKANEQTLRSLAEQHGKLMGHQNHNQKIQHLVKIKVENQELKTQMAKLEMEVRKLHKMLEREREASKENRDVRSMSEISMLIQ